MVKYECFRCGYIAKQKSNLINHLKRKNICEPKISNISIENVKKIYCFEMTPNDSKMTHIDSIMTINVKNKEYICSYCGNSYSKNCNMRRHEKKCKIKMEKEKTDLEKDNEIKELKEMVEKLLVNSGGNTITNNTNTNNTNSNNTTNNTVNIHINNYGDENTKYITNDFILNLLNKPYSAIPELIKYTHFNDKHPENQNIKLTNKKEPFVKVLKNNKWELADRKDTITDLIDKKHSLLNTIDIKNNFNNNTYNRIELFNQKYLNDNKELLNKLYKDSELVLLNNS